MNKDTRIKKRLILFIAVSLLLHLSLLIFIYEVPLFRSEVPPPPPAPEVVFVRPEDVMTAPPSGGELVDLAKPDSEKIPEKARFVSQYNSSVKDETVARKIPKKARPDVDRSEAPERAKPKQQAKTTEPVSPSSEKTSEAPPKLGKTPEQLSLSDLQVKTSDYKDLAKEFGSKEGKKDGKESDKGPDIAAIHRFSDVGPGDRFVHDFMPNVKIGDKTYLNAAAMPNVQYFTQLKRIFRMSFSPERPLIAHFRYNHVVVGTVTVTMAMEVGPSGSLNKLFVVKSSGIPGYDEEALRTVRHSSPFAAPPQAIMGKDGVLRMTWHFTTYL